MKGARWSNERRGHRPEAQEEFDELEQRTGDEASRRRLLFVYGETQMKRRRHRLNRKFIKIIMRENVNRREHRESSENEAVSIKYAVKKNCP